MVLRLQEAMDMFGQILRFSAIAAAAFFSLATSIVYDEVGSITPLPGETAVPVDQIPTVATTTEVDLDRAVVSLVRASDEAPVAGQVVSALGDDGYYQLRLIPAVPLEPETEYVFSVANGLDGYSYFDPITNRTATIGGAEPDLLEVRFTTDSAPRVRHTRRFDGHAHLYLSFSQEMNPSTLTIDTVRLFLDGAEEAPLAVIYDGGPAHVLDITARRVDFAAADVAFDGVEAADGTLMPPETVEIAPPR